MKFREIKKYFLIKFLLAATIFKKPTILFKCSKIKIDQSIIKYTFDNYDKIGLKQKT